ncbi:MAG: hypothetical protein HZA91_11610 [Verrucomicrobia bacterium]|nr:hypothetical protein [Verrucomicrobiota bacterium]
MANNDYIESLKHVIHRLHGCDSQWERTAPVHEVFRGQTVWKGEIEVFALAGHPKAKRCYAWAHRTGPDDRDARVVAVLELPPVESPETAVRASITSDFKKQKSAKTN